MGHVSRWGPVASQLRCLVWGPGGVPAGSVCPSRAGQSSLFMAVRAPPRQGWHVGWAGPSSALLSSGAFMARSVDLGLP